MAATDRSTIVERGEHLEQTLKIMVEAGRIKKENCDTIIQQYSKLCENLHISGSTECYRAFNHKKEDQRVDVLLQNSMNKYSELWDVAQQLLLLSHGQASVERGFSVNKQTTEVNLSKESLTARMLILQAVREAGDAAQVEVNKEMLSYASGARSKYQDFLDNQKKEEVSRIVAEKRKADEEELVCLKEKKLRLIQDATCLEQSADQKAKDAQTLRKWELIVESNTLRDKARELKKNAGDLDKLISKRESDGRLPYPNP